MKERIRVREGFHILKTTRMSQYQHKQEIEEMSDEGGEDLCLLFNVVEVIRGRVRPAPDGSLVSRDEEVVLSSCGRISTHGHLGRSHLEKRKDKGR